MIKNNEWVTGDSLPWNLGSQYQSLRIQRKLRDIQLEIDVKNTIMSIRADLWRNKQNLKIDNKGIFINGVVKNSGFSNLGFVGARISVNTKTNKFSLTVDPRFPNARMISGITQVRIQEGIEYWKKTVYP